MLKVSNQGNHSIGFIVIYIYILLFSGFVLKILGCPKKIGFSLISLLDILPLVIWIISNPSFKIKTKDFFLDTLKFWVAWLILLILLLFTTVVHQSPIGHAFADWGALVRYIPIGFVIVSLSRQGFDIRGILLRHFKIIAFILLVAGYICIIIGPHKAIMFLPLLPENATGKRETLLGNYAVFFANTVDYGFILFVFYIIFIYRKGINLWRAFLITVIFFIPIFRTGSAAGTFVFSVVAFFRLTQTNKLFRYVLVVIVLSFIGALIYIHWDMVLFVVDNTRLSRLGMITQTAPDFLKEKSFDTFFGIGVDPYVVYAKVNSYSDKVFMLEYIEPKLITSAFGDVYWVALLVYHGVIGLFVLIYIFYKLFRSTANKMYIDDEFDYNKIIKWLFFAICFLAFLNQVIVVKTFSIIFWIFISMTYVSIIHEKR